MWKLPREEEPQIIVPMIDVFVQMPGASAREVEERVTKPMEKLLWEIPGVEYIYSTSSPGMSLAIVRFYVGQDEEKSIVRLNQKLLANFDLIPPGASQPLVKPRSIDDVPILALTLSSRRYGDFELRRIAAQLDDTIKQVPDVSAVTLIGGQRREVRIVLDPARLAALSDLRRCRSRERSGFPTGACPRASSTRQIASTFWKPASSCAPPRTCAMSSSASRATSRSSCAMSPKSPMAAQSPREYVRMANAGVAGVPARRDALDRQAQGHERRRRRRERPAAASSRSRAS